jgi:2-polyprenyl-6-methoxyphenol hydroxylase-like FAD-dependent oxidoreductase
LARRGRSSIVLEQRDAFTTAGAGIQLGPNGVRVLQRLGVAQALRPLVGEPEAICVYDGRTARSLATLPLGAWIAARHGAPYWVAHRGDLHGALLAAAAAEPRIALRPGFALAFVEETEEGVRAASVGGEVVAGCALVGADGLWSSVEAEADRTLLLHQVRGFHTGLTEVLARVPQWRKWALYRLPPLPRWSVGRIALLGDAAHPMLPYLAQGGVLALEDALALGDCLEAHSGNAASAFRDFEAKRRARAERVQAASLRQGRIYHLAAPLSWARDAALRLVPGAWLMAGYDWLYGWRGSDAN